MNFFTKVKPIFETAFFQARRNGGIRSKLPTATIRGMAAQPSASDNEIGPDKDLIIELLKEGDIPEVKELMKKHFYLREPLCVMQNLTYEDHKEVLNDLIQEWMKKNVSFVTRERKTKKIVGSMLASIITKNEDENLSKIISSNENYSIKARIDLRLVEIMKSQVDLFKKYNVDKMVQMELGTVDPAYLKRNISIRMIMESAKQAATVFGCQLMTAQVTNIASQVISQKQGFTVEAEMDFDSMRVDGKQVLDLKKHNSTTKAQLVSCRL